MGIGVAQQLVDGRQPEASLSCHISVGIEGEQRVEQRGERRELQRIARGDIHLVGLFGQAVDDGGQQFLVAEHDGRLLAIVNPLVF